MYYVSSKGKLWETADSGNIGQLGLPGELARFFTVLVRNRLRLVRQISKLIGYCGFGEERERRMKWLFGERFCLETDMKPEFVMGILREHVNQIRFQRGDLIIGPVPLFDKLTVKEEGRFSLLPSIELSRNSFRPIWNCVLEENGTRARLKVRAQSPGSFLFLLVVLGFWGNCGYHALLGRVSQSYLVNMFVISALVAVFAFLGFWCPEQRAKEGLLKYLGGRFTEDN